MQLALFRCFRRQNPCGFHKRQGKRIYNLKFPTDTPLRVVPREGNAPSLILSFTSLSVALFYGLSVAGVRFPALNPSLGRRVSNPLMCEFMLPIRLVAYRPRKTKQPKNKCSLYRSSCVSMMSVTGLRVIYTAAFSVPSETDRKDGSMSSFQMLRCRVNVLPRG